MLILLAFNLSPSEERNTCFLIATCCLMVQETKLASCDDDANPSAKKKKKKYWDNFSAMLSMEVSPFIYFWW